MTVRDDVLFSYHLLYSCHPVVIPTVATIATPAFIPTFIPARLSNCHPGPSFHPSIRTRHLSRKKEISNHPSPSF